MKKSKLFGWAFIAALTSAGFSSCSNDTEEVLLKESEIKLTSEITASRVASLDYQSTQIVQGQKVGVTITNAKSEHNNVSWVAGANGTLSTENKVYWKNSDVDIVAYHPYKEGWIDKNYTFTVNTDQSVESNYLNSDLLYAESKGVSKSEEAIPLTFRHKLAKINVTLEPEFRADLSGATISICNVDISTLFNPATGYVSDETSNTQEIKAGITTEESYTASAIVVPQTVKSGKNFIRVVHNGKTYYYTLSSDKQLLEGYSHNYTLVVRGNTQLTVKSSNIVDWIGDGGNIGSAEEVEKVPNNQIWYTTSDGEILNPITGTDFGANVESNIYKNGMGIITFDGDVTRIGTLTASDSQAFSYCTTLSSIHLPETVTAIGQFSFGCSSLKDINIPNGVTEIGQSAFVSCESLKTVFMPETVTAIDESAFAYCESLETVIMPNVESVGNMAFIECKSLTNISLPNSILTIGDEAFRDCSSINITIPENVTSIGNGAFVNCHSIVDIAIPASVNNIGGGVFAGCQNLEMITVAAGNVNYSSYDGGLYDKDKETLMCFPCAKTSVVFPYSIKEIDGNAFYNTSLSNLEIPDGVTMIGNYAFYESSLSKVIIPASVQSIGMMAFENNNNLSEVYCKALTPPALGGYVFPTGLSSIYVPENYVDTYKTAPEWKGYADKIKGYNFTSSYSNGEAYVALGGELSSVISLVDKNTITSLKITGYLNSDDIRFIREMAGGTFDYNTMENGALKTLDISECIIVEGGSAFGKHEWEELGYTTSNNRLGQYAFAYTGLERVYLPMSVTELDDCILSNCINLIEVSIPDNVTAMYSYIFGGSDKLTEITLPKNLQAFSPATFNGCSSLAEIKIDGSNQFYYIHTDGVMYGYNDELYCNPAASETKDIQVQEGTTVVHTHAFSWCANVETIVIPSSVTEIGDDAFSYCSKLSSVTFSSLTAPKIDWTIHDTALNTTSPGSAFDCIGKDIVIYVPKGSGDTYKEAWKDVLVSDESGNTKSIIGFIQEVQ